MIRKAKVSQLQTTEEESNLKYSTAVGINDHQQTRVSHKQNTLRDNRSQSLRT